MDGATWDQWVIGLPALALGIYLLWRLGQRWQARGWRERGRQFEKGRKDADLEDTK